MQGLREEGAEIVPLGHASVAALGRMSTVFDWPRTSACVVDVRSARVCSALTVTPEEQVAPAAFLFGRRAYPSVHELPRTPPYDMEYELAVDASRIRGSWTIDVLDDPHSSCPWRFVRQQGLVLDGTLPASTVILRSGHPENARLVVAKRFGDSNCGDELDRLFPPCLFETGEHDDTWRAAIRSGWAQ